MFSSKARGFDRRSDSIVRRTRKLNRGAVMRVNSDGLIVARPRRHGLGLSLKGLVLVVGAVWVFKILAILNLGVDEYSSRLVGLQEGNTAEKATAWVMEPGPITMEAVRQLVLANDMIRQARQKTGV